MGKMAWAFPGDLIVVHGRDGPEIFCFYVPQLMEIGDRSMEYLASTGFDHRRIVCAATVVKTENNFFGQAEH